MSTTPEWLQQLANSPLPTITMGLERVEALLDVLGNPQHRLPPVVHVAGTNGKGSTLAYLSAVCDTLGIRWHRYTSPHLVRFHERIVLNGQEVEDTPLNHALARVAKACENTPATFFEATTVAAFLLFAEHPADVLLLETGMGGRLDATNVVNHPLLTLITPVAMDHEDYLGHTIAAIAAEKAGIIKAHTPLVLARQAMEANRVIRGRAGMLQAPVYAAGEAYDWYPVLNSTDWEWQQGETLWRLPAPALAGEHQYGNASTALMAAQLMTDALGYSLTEPQAADAMRNTRHPARLQRLSTGPDGQPVPHAITLWLDGGHNPQAGEALAEFLRDQPPTPRFLITTLMQDKKAEGFLRPLHPYITEAIAVGLPQEPRAYTPEDMLQLLITLGFTAQKAHTAQDAYRLALESLLPEGGQILIAGSLFLAGDVLYHAATCHTSPLHP